MTVWLPIHPARPMYGRLQKTSIHNRSNSPELDASSSSDGEAIFAKSAAGRLGSSLRTAECRWTLEKHSLEENLR